ncbi:MAG: thiamine pyrophosphate-binding protein [Chloroflexi bacterium]|nr:thiamine pyrophosphate-binding protein [Chloroflexota bacterium]
MHGYEAVADALAKEGTEHIFAVSASDNMELLIDLKDNKGIRVVSARKESGAAGMADGYSRTTGNPGICTVTLGPGLANAATSLMTAARHKSPVLCLTTERNTFDRMSPKGIGLDQRQFVEALEGTYIRVGHARTLADDMRTAFRRLRSGKGPVVLALPQETMKGKLDGDWEYSPVAASMPARQRVQPDPEPVARAAAILQAAKLPVIVAGRGAAEAGAEFEVSSLAELTGSLIATTLMARGFLARHPYNAGISGPLASDDMRLLLSGADCVLAVGCGLNVYTVEFGSLYAKAQIIHIDHDPAVIGSVTPVALGITGDAKACLVAIEAELRRQRMKKRRGFWTRDVESLISKSRSTRTSPYVQAPDAIDPNELIAEMDRVLPQERIIVLDGGHHRYFPALGMSLWDPSQFVWTGDVGSVGLALYQGIGAAIGRPDKHVAVFVGDGGLMMSLEELDTAVRYRVPMTVVVMNDNAFGSEVHRLKRHGKPVDIALFDDNPDFALVAVALGASGVTVKSAADVRALAGKVGKADAPFLVDARVNREVSHPIKVFQLGQYANRLHTT